MPRPLTPHRIPSKLPTGYVERTLARLLPSEEQLANLDRSQLVQLVERKRELERLIAADPTRFFRPEPGGQWDYMTCPDPNVQARYFFAGNKSGKTTASAVCCAELACGRQLWFNALRPSMVAAKPPPLRMAFYSEDFETHDETIVPTYLTWLPKTELKGVHRGPSGNIAYLTHRNGTVIFLKTYAQGFDRAEGKDYDVVWCDEPPPRDIYTAIWRGLVSLGGRLFISATLLKEAWLFDELDNPFVKCYDATIYDNSWIDAQSRENFVQLLNEDEKAIRVYGKPTTLTGIIYNGFSAGPPWVIPDEPYPWDPTRSDSWPVVMAVDPHERKPLYVEWAYVEPDGRIRWFDWALVPNTSLRDVFRVLKEHERLHPSPTRLCVMDPNRGRARQMGGRSWQESFEDEGYPVELGDDNIGIGHTRVRDMLYFKDALGLPSPRMRWTESCQGRGGPLWQMGRYMWEDWSRRLRTEKEVKEKPKDTNKDFPDLHRYVAMAQLDFDALCSGYEQVKLFTPRPNGRGVISAY